MSYTSNATEISKEIERFEKDYYFYLEHRNGIKKWCVTIWAAVLLSVSTGEFKFSSMQFFLFLTILICMFWFLEAFYGSVTIRRERTISLLENRLAISSFEFNDPSEIHLFSNERKISALVKMEDMFKGIATKESISLLYVFLIAATGVISKFLKM
jgi:hypothetical protein